jgi:hypothetical protein
MPPIFPDALYVAGSSLEPYTTESDEEIERDPRGLVLMWEGPIKTAKYVMGMDTAEGVTGWSRILKKDGDTKTDNSAIEIFRVDGDFELCFKLHNGQRIPDIDPTTKRQKRIYKDVQVAEFAAPCDPVEAARVANVLGRIYSGDADEQCLFVWEAWPGCGLLATQEILRLGYANQWMWQYIDREAEDTDRPGWRSTRESQKLLWYRARRHLMGRRVTIRSKPLLEEYSNAEIDLAKMRARASYGFHDDRMQAANMCFWAGHSWSYTEDGPPDEVRTTAEPRDYQRIAPVLDDEHYTFQAWKEDQLAQFD